MPSHDELKDQARARARNMLSTMPSFRGMEQAEQMALYKDVVNSEYKQLQVDYGLVPTPAQPDGMAQQSGLVTALGDRGASRDIDEERHRNPNIERAGKLAADFVDDVNFPQFVRDLLKGVFDANLEVTHQQMEDFGKLVEQSTKSLAEFAKGFSDDDALFQLAERQGDKFGSMMMTDDNRPTIADKNGKPIDPDSTELKAAIMNAKLEMARERRALLREILLMGVTRLVVERGVVKAAVVFDIKASEKIEKADRAARNRETTSARTFGGGLGGLFGGQRSSTTKETRISISSAKSQSTTDLSAQITGSVEIQFKTDYFKLDNFLQMYGAQGQAGQPPIPGQAPRPAGQPALVPGQQPAPGVFPR